MPDSEKTAGQRAWSAPRLQRIESLSTDGYGTGGAHSGMETLIMGMTSTITVKGTASNESYMSAHTYGPAGAS